MVKTGLGCGAQSCPMPILPDPGARLKRAGIMASTRPRPLSPHLSVWRWGPGMVVSILHRFTGAALSIAGLAILTWWLVAISGGPDDYARFTMIATHPLGPVVLAGLT